MSGSAEATPIEATETQRADAEALQRRGTRQLLMVRALFMVFGYASSVVLARELGPADFGFYGVVLATMIWLEIVSYAGVPAAVGKLIPEHGEQAVEVERAARFVLFLTSMVLFGIGWAAAPAIGRMFQLPDGGRLFRIAILDLPLSAAYAGYGGILMARRRFGPYAASQGILGAARLIAVLTLLELGVSVEHALLAYVAATATALLYLVVRYPPDGFRPGKPFIRRILSIGIPMGAFVIALQVLISLDVWLLGSIWHGGKAAVGQYIAALKIAQTLIVIPMVQSGVLLASVAWALAADDREGARRHMLEASRFALILAAAACAIVGGCASSLMGFLYSSAYASGGIYLVLQLLAFSFFAIMDTFAHALMAAGRQRGTALTLVAFIPLVAASNFLLIPRIGPVGAAISLLVGMAGVTVVVSIMVWRQFGFPFDGGTVARVAAAAAAVAIASAWIPSPGALILVKMAALGVVYLAVLWLLGEITRADFALPRAKSPMRASP